MMYYWKKAISLFLLVCAFNAQGISCTNSNLDVVILGSGGPEIALFRSSQPLQPRASASYLLRENGQAKFIIDLGSGALQRFAQTNAKIEDLQAILVTHFHVDHINDLPTLIKSSFFSERKQDLLIYGPTGNEFIPDTVDFLSRLLGEKGAYAYLADFLTGEESYQIIPTSVDANKQQPTIFHTTIDGFDIKAVGTEHGLLPALAWRIEKAGCSVVFSGDTSNLGRTLDLITKDADLFIAHNAIPETSQDNVAQKLHMRPSEIARIAHNSNIKNLVLSHLMRRTEQVKTQTEQVIKSQFQGNITFANDCDIYSIKTGNKIGECTNLNL
ncbi:MBL fold metallo-hydrolase [Pasteurella canis]|uniref:Arylsulfatase n=1 Tax=Pasteurella canis TaxID=753 RepID=A0ABQ4VGB2_9PAST|nr:MBL fold metallo-hydrolase [Pasteurella canis]UEC22500.1 MBL fold metallo-hydrolase [Pasteurella canis]GJH43053.1 arylsulfatase [Pasteurella canis]